MADCQGRTGLLAAQTSPTMLLTCTATDTGTTRIAAYAGQSRTWQPYERDVGAG